MLVRVSLRPTSGFELQVEAGNQGLGQISIDAQSHIDDSLNLRFSLSVGPDSRRPERDLDGPGDDRNVDERVGGNADDPAVIDGREGRGLLNHVDISGWFTGARIVSETMPIAKRSEESAA